MLVLKTKIWRQCSNAVCDGSTPEAEKQVIFEGITDEDIATLTLEE